MDVVNEVKRTNDYSIFKCLYGNRDVNKQHVHRLQKSFEKVYLRSPILVNEKYEIIDGQHRFEAAKQMELPINFIVCENYGLKEVQLLNANMKNWTKKDYLDSYSEQGYPEYLKFRDFMHQYPDFSLPVCQMLLSNTTRGGDLGKKSKTLKSETNKGGDYTSRTFINGDFKISDYNTAILLAEKLLSIKPFYRGYNRGGFVKSMITIFKHKHYTHSRFLNKLSINPTGLKDCANVNQYKILIEDIYNYRSSHKVSLRY